MPVELSIRRADPSDAATVMRLLDDATRWLAERGTEQWQRMEHRRIGVDRDTVWRTLFVVEDEGATVGTITVDKLADTDFWTHSDLVRSALYVHRMAVARNRSGEGIGSAMLNWACSRALQQGRTTLRLDAWRDNYDLHKYYEKQGFVHLRTEPVPGRGSGALFERPAEVRIECGARIGRRAHASSRR